MPAAVKKEEDDENKKGESCMGSMGPIDPPEMEKEKGQKASKGQARAQPTSGVEIWLGITRKLAREGEREALAVPREVHTSFDVRRPSKEDPGRRDFGGERGQRFRSISFSIWVCSFDVAPNSIYYTFI